MFEVVGNETSDTGNNQYTYESYKKGEILITRGDYLEALKAMTEIFGLMVAIDTKRVYIYDNEKGYYKETNADQITGIYSNLTNEHNSTQTADVFKRKLFKWFGEPFCYRQERIIDMFVKTSKRYVCFRNGVFDVQKGHFYKHDKKFYFRTTLTANYDLDKEPLFFNKWMDDFTTNRADVKRTILEFMSYCLISGYHYGHKFLVLRGAGRNGKSTLVRTLSKIIGPLGRSAVPMDLLSGFNLASTAGKLLNHSEEASGAWVKGEELANLKAVTGGDEIMINGKYEKPYVEKNFPKMLFSMNQVPKFGESTVALRKRLICVECRMDLSDIEDDSIEERLQEEIDSIATMLVHKLEEVVKNKSVYVYPDNVKEILEVEMENDIYTRFFYDRIIVDQNAPIGLWSDQIWEDFEKYCRSEDPELRIYKNLFIKKIKFLLPRDIVATKKRNNGKIRTYFRGIDLYPLGDYHGTN